MPAELLTAVIRCPLKLCQAELEGNWLAPEDPEDDTPEPTLHICPECGHIWAAAWPGFSFRAEA